MKRYSEAYLDEIVETQGRLFDFVSQNFPEKDTADFINFYMKSKTRKYIDEGMAFVCTMDAPQLWSYFLGTDKYELKDGQSIGGFCPDWIGEFYALYQWEYGIPSSIVVEKVPVSFLEKAYPGLHDLQLSLAVQKVGGSGGEAE